MTTTVYDWPALVSLATGYFIALNLIGYFLMGWDKRRAVKAGPRIPEARLFSVALLGGATGMYLGMNFFRHKTQHAPFRIGLPLIILFHAGVIYFAVVR